MRISTQKLSESESKRANEKKEKNKGTEMECMSTELDDDYKTYFYIGDKRKFFQFFYVFKKLESML